MGEDEMEVMLEDIEKRAEKLNDWESLFIDDIQTKLRRGTLDYNSLSTGQKSKIEQIWEKVTA